MRVALQNFKDPKVQNTTKEKEKKQKPKNKRQKQE